MRKGNASHLGNKDGAILLCSVGNELRTTHMHSSLSVNDSSLDVQTHLSFPSCTDAVALSPARPPAIVPLAPEIDDEQFLQIILGPDPELRLLWSFTCSPLCPCGP
ncbi:uncharacterized [Tachysurus ichikawai]